ncbi:MAG: hypothetical protein ICV79_22555, partial [Flavisolibacter sp.]|nr:hypothetical protein [Flavisolibacter sp.]
VNAAIYPYRFRPSIGLTFENQFSSYSGVETGLFYRIKKFSSIITYAGTSGSHSVAVLEHHLNVPVLYKYYSRIINISVGPAIDFYIGWKQQKNESTILIQNYDVDPEVKLGFLAKVSKVIALNKQMILEPELRYSSIQRLGIGIAGKYRL